MKRFVLVPLFLIFVVGECATVFEFTRLANTCDLEGDVEIGPSGTTKVVWAYNDEDPVSENEILRHQARGTRSVNLLGHDTEPVPLEPDVFTIQLSNDKVPVTDSRTGEPVDTLYYCKPFRLPADKKRHIVRYEPIFENGNIEYVHHIMMYSCPRPIDLSWEDDCFKEDNPPPVQECLSSTVMAAWAVGGGAWNLPKEAAYPIGDNYAEYIIMEVHYDNPFLRNVVDSSGFQLYVTEMLREHDAGIMAIAHSIPAIRVPPQQESFDVLGECTSDCTTDVFEKGAKVFGVMLHAHLLGRGIKLQHIRDGFELPILDDNPNYDFDFQETLPINPPRDVYPKDEFIVTCTYNSMDKFEETVGGFSTREEMCEAWISYYPAKPDRPYDYCASGSLEDGVYRSFCNASDTGTPIDPIDFTALPNIDRCEGFEPGNYSIVPVLSDEDEWDPLKYQHQMTLDQDEKFKLYWTHDQDSGEMHIAMEVETPGWAGIGFSPNGDMTNSDVYIAWVDQQQNVFFRDRFAPGRFLPVVDRQQDVYDISGFQSESKTDRKIREMFENGLREAGRMNQKKRNSVN